MNIELSTYDVAKSAFIQQLNRLRDRIIELPEPEDKTMSIKEWLLQEAWVLDDAIWDITEEVVSEKTKK
jgi:hypothetical protein